jgi:hypothetical protein
MQTLPTRLSYQIPFLALFGPEIEIVAEFLSVFASLLLIFNCVATGLQQSWLLLGDRHRYTCAKIPGAINDGNKVRELRLSLRAENSSLTDIHRPEQQQLCAKQNAN